MIEPSLPHGYGSFVWLGQRPRAKLADAGSSACDELPITLDYFTQIIIRLFLASCSDPIAGGLVLRSSLARIDPPVGPQEIRLSKALRSHDPNGGPASRTATVPGGLWKF